MDGKRERARAGQAIVEFALTSLLLLTVIFGTIDLGRAVFTRTMLTNAVREAARQGSIEISNRTTNASTVTTVMAAAANARSPSLTFTASSFTVTCTTWPTTIVDTGFARNCDSTVGINSSPPPVSVEDRIKVCTDYPFSFIAGRLIGRSTITFHECEQTSVQ
jgi:Flp pilus assembly protein TadG